MVSATIHVRLDPSSQARLKAAAAAHQRSVAWWAARLIDEGLDRPETPAIAPEQPKAPVAPRPPGKRLIFGTPKTADLVYSAIEDALAEHGMDLADGRRTVTADRVLADFEVKRRELSRRPKKTESVKQLDADGYRVAAQMLVAIGAICGDPAVMVWLPTA